MVDDSRELEQPIIYRYVGYITQPHLGKIDFWRQQLDDLIAIVWRPYRSLEPWDDWWLVHRDLFVMHPLIGRSHTIVDWFIVSRVMRQYGRPQGISQEFTAYARYADEERQGWSPRLSYALAMQELTSLQCLRWDYMDDVADARVLP